MKKLEDMKNLDDRFIKDTRSGIGMYNVVRRLEIEYGENVVVIGNFEGEGTEVRMRLLKE